MRERVSLKGRSETSYACCRDPYPVPPLPCLYRLLQLALRLATRANATANLAMAANSVKFSLRFLLPQVFPYFGKCLHCFLASLTPSLCVRLSLRSVTHLTTFTVCPDLHNQFESVFGRISNQFRVKPLRILMQCPPADHLRISISISMDSREQQQLWSAGHLIGSKNSRSQSQRAGFLLGQRGKLVSKEPKPKDKAKAKAKEDTRRRRLSWPDWIAICGRIWRS